MNHCYVDITARLGEPQWWDEHAVPRYCDYSPRHIANIYASETALLEIACQNCGTRFTVGMSAGALDDNLAELVKADAIHYGDPPNAGCCPAGPTMNSIPLRVLEFWEREKGDWERQPELERSIGCKWVA